MIWVAVLLAVLMAGAGAAAGLAILVAAGKAAQELANKSESTNGAGSSSGGGKGGKSKAGKAAKDAIDARTAERAARPRPRNAFKAARGLGAALGDTYVGLKAGIAEREDPPPQPRTGPHWWNHAAAGARHTWGSVVSVINAAKESLEETNTERRQRRAEEQGRVTVVDAEIVDDDPAEEAAKARRAAGYADEEAGRPAASDHPDYRTGYDQSAAYRKVAEDTERRRAAHAAGENYPPPSTTADPLGDPEGLVRQAYEWGWLNAGHEEGDPGENTRPEFRAGWADRRAGVYRHPDGSTIPAAERDQRIAADREGKCKGCGQRPATTTAPDVFTGEHEPYCGVCAPKATKIRQDYLVENGRMCSSCGQREATHVAVTTHPDGRTEQRDKLCADCARAYRIGTQPEDDSDTAPLATSTVSAPDGPPQHTGVHVPDGRFDMVDGKVTTRCQECGQELVFTGKGDNTRTGPWSLDPADWAPLPASGSVPDASLEHQSWKRGAADASNGLPSCPDNADDEDYQQGYEWWHRDQQEKADEADEGGAGVIVVTPGMEADHQAKNAAGWTPEYDLYEQQPFTDLTGVSQQDASRVCGLGGCEGVQEAVPGTQHFDADGGAMVDSRCSEPACGAESSITWEWTDKPPAENEHYSNNAEERAEDDAERARERAEISRISDDVLDGNAKFGDVKTVLNAAVAAGIISREEADEMPGVSDWLLDRIAEVKERELIAMSPGDAAKDLASLADRGVITEADRVAAEARITRLRDQAAAEAAARAEAERKVAEVFDGRRGPLASGSLDDARRDAERAEHNQRVLACAVTARILTQQEADQWSDFRPAAMAHLEEKLDQFTRGDDSPASTATFTTDDGATFHVTSTHGEAIDRIDGPNVQYVTDNGPDTTTDRRIEDRLNAAERRVAADAPAQAIGEHHGNTYKTTADPGGSTTTEFHTTNAGGDTSMTTTTETQPDGTVVETGAASVNRLVAAAQGLSAWSQNAAAHFDGLGDEAATAINELVSTGESVQTRVTEIEQTLGAASGMDEGTQAGFAQQLEQASSAAVVAMEAARSAEETLTSGRASMAEALSSLAAACDATATHIEEGHRHRVEAIQSGPVEAADDMSLYKNE